MRAQIRYKETTDHKPAAPPTSASAPGTSIHHCDRYNASHVRTIVSGKEKIKNTKYAAYSYSHAEFQRKSNVVSVKIFECASCKLPLFWPQIIDRTYEELEKLTNSWNFRNFYKKLR